MAGRFAGSISTIAADRLPYSWRAGCPVATSDLRLITATYVSFSGAIASGELVVHRDVAANVLTLLRQLFEMRYPIARMELVDKYGGDDERSMAANNTSAFNCRPVSGRPGIWSQHAYGRAIDLNPVQNPLISRSGKISPPAGAVYLNRSIKRPGMITARDDVVSAFDAIGWKWGGYWSDSRDYQHFSLTGR